jgi:NTE family protein
VDADLVLEGGGVKGIGLVGAISVLEERGYRFHRVAGTSAGSIVGALVAAGMRAPALVEVMRRVDYTRFRDPTVLSHFGLPGEAMSVLFDEGAFKGDALVEWLTGQLESVGVSTFADLRDDDPASALPAEQRFRLVAMTSDISEGRLRRLPWDYPLYGLDPATVKVVDAVRASMSIPFFYQPVKLRHDHGLESWLVDGGMLSNFPVDVFDRPAGERPRWPTFGIKLSARPDAALGVAHDIHGPVSYAEAMLGTMTGFHDQMHLDDPAVLARTIFVDSMKVRATDFDLDATTREQLYANGRAAAVAFLDGTDHSPAWDFDAYVARFRSAPASTAPAPPDPAPTLHAV